MTVQGSVLFSKDVVAGSLTPLQCLALAFDHFAREHDPQSVVQQRLLLDNGNVCLLPTAHIGRNWETPYATALEMVAHTYNFSQRFARMALRNSGADELTFEMPKAMFNALQARLQKCEGYAGKVALKAC